MALQLGRTCIDGIERVMTRTGGLLLVGLIVIQLLTQALINTAVVDIFPAGPAGELEALLGLTLPIPGAVAGVCFVGVLVLSSAYFVVLSRALARPTAELSTLPSTLVTRRIGRATLSMLVGGLVVGVAVTLGLALILVPGIFLAACFLFVIFAVGVEDRGWIGALKRSWALSRGARLKLAVVVILAGVLGGVVGAVGTVLDLARSPVVAELVSNTLNSILFTVLYGIMASAYLQVREEGPGGREGPVATEPTGHTGVTDG
ncbi:hypothetical protein ACOZ4L_13055 [Haloplanus ruber]|uniref:DUF7847 domain-containing protein n=1 Tax=Haloplanus ruber TaxID=869892 RepID=A0ABD6D0F7_9EURY|nr:hypothetical protein [Haloplanus ruber]